ncbi:unnamed protein product, partial [Tilletia controversa]
LALLNNAPRAASIVANQPAAGASSTARLRVATLSEQAFTRLLGPLAGIMSRHAETHYGAADLHASAGVGAGVSHMGMSTSPAARAGGAGAGAGAGAGGGGAGPSAGYPFGSAYVLGSTPAHSVQAPAPHEAHLHGGFSTGGGGGGSGHPLRGPSPAPAAGGPFAMDLAAAPDQGGGTWLGASPFGASPFGGQGGPPPAA